VKQVPLFPGLDVGGDGQTKKGCSVRATRPSVKSIFVYETGEFLGSARVSERRRKRHSVGGVGPVRAGEVLKPNDLKRLKVEPSTVIYAS
jgi:hypothetical protein